MVGSLEGGKRGGGDWRGEFVVFVAPQELNCHRILVIVDLKKLYFALSRTMGGGEHWLHYRLECRYSDIFPSLLLGEIDFWFSLNEWLILGH